MDANLIGMTRERAMRLAAELTISGTAEHIIELVRVVQWSALIAAHGLPEARRIVSELVNEVKDHSGST